MSEHAVPIGGPGGRPLVRVVKAFLSSEVRGTAFGLPSS